jgi:hypothetical protein
MSLYREAGRGGARTLALAVAVALIAGLAVGFAIGRASAPESSAADVVSSLRSDLRPVAGGLELLPNEYAQAYRGEGVESEGVRGAVGRIESQLDAALPDLRALDPAGAATLNQRVRALADAVSAKASPAEVKQRSEAAAAALRAVPGGR